jgi:hypothetical protein
LRIIHERLRLCVGCVRLVNARLAPTSTALQPRNRGRER